MDSIMINSDMQIDNDNDDVSINAVPLEDKICYLESYIDVRFSSDTIKDQYNTWMKLNKVWETRNLGNIYLFMSGTYEHYDYHLTSDFTIKSIKNVIFQSNDRLKYLGTPMSSRFVSLEPEMKTFETKFQSPKIRDIYEELSREYQKDKSRAKIRVTGMSIDSYLIIDCIEDPESNKHWRITSPFIFDIKLTKEGVTLGNFPMSIAFDNSKAYEICKLIATMSIKNQWLIRVYGRFKTSIKTLVISSFESIIIA